MAVILRAPGEAGRRYVLTCVACLGVVVVATRVCLGMRCVRTRRFVAAILEVRHS